MVYVVNCYDSFTHTLHEGHLDNTNQYKAIEIMSVSSNCLLSSTQSVKTIDDTLINAYVVNSIKIDWINLNVMRHDTVKTNSNSYLYNCQFVNQCQNWLITERL